MATDNNQVRADQVLVVDDTAANLKLLVDLLTARGYQVRAAGSGPLALRSIAVEQPDIILLDIRMPGMDGYEVCRRLKADDRYNDIPVIFLSAMNNVPEKVRAFQTGAVDYITKPFESEEILARIGTHLRLRHLQSDMETLVARRTEELIRTHKSLEESEVRYQAMFENNVASMAIIEEDMTISLCNRAFCGLSGYSREEIEGRITFGDLAAKADERMKMEEYHGLRRTDPGKAPRTYEYQLREKNGNLRDMFISVDLLPGTRKSMMTMIDLTERNRALAAVEKSLREKVVLLREIHHRVRNNLQIIISMLNLQCAGCEDEFVGSVLKDVQNRIRSMSLVQDLLYQSEDFSGIDFVEYIHQMSALLHMSYGVSTTRVAIEYKLSNIALRLDQAIPCGLILNELIANSLRHGFPNGRKGSILIEMAERGEREVFIKVADNGVGLPKSFSIEKTGVIGLILVENLVRQLGGDLEITSTGGTEFHVTFPLE